MKKCQNCGQELPDDAKVCDNCGEPVEITNEDRSENEVKPDNMQDVQTNNENTGNNNEAQQPADSANKPEAQEVDSEDEDLVHEHLEPGLNIETEKEIEKEQQVDPQNEEAEDYTVDED
ncbi:zinc ribbon domain-containing protein [Carnobacteriaceae bacterium 52-44]